MTRHVGKSFEMTPELQRLLESGGIAAHEFGKARSFVTSFRHYREALDKAPAALVEYRAVIARAFIAAAVALLRKKASSLPSHTTRDCAMRRSAS
jgi:hypothetical protein